MSSGQLSPDGKWIWNGTEWVPNLPTDNSAVQIDNAKEDLGIITVDPDLLSQIQVDWAQQYRDDGTPAPWHDSAPRISFIIPANLPQLLKDVLVVWAEEMWIWLSDGDNSSISAMLELFDSNTVSRLDSLLNEIKGRWHEYDKTLYFGSSSEQQKRKIRSSFYFFAFYLGGFWYWWSKLEDDFGENFIFEPIVGYVIDLVGVCFIIRLIWEVFVFLAINDIVLAYVYELEDEKQEENRLDASAQPKSSLAEAGSSIDTHQGDENVGKTVVQNITYNIQDSVIQQKE